ncbi:hypothetical protein N7475_010202 [Penicillium sp. IBT 31633x]|nr:hypothetical protein N7475_010202 [Penicillium sp. IBT 31633x]
MACVSCRESKCNGGQPSCSTCINRDRECSYRTIDKRKLPLRVAIELLTLKVNQLRQFICDNGLEPPRLPLEKETALKKILENFGLNEAGPIPLQTGDGDRERPLNTPRDLPCLPSVTYIDTPTTRDLFGVSDSLAERDSETNLHTKLSPLTQPTQNEHLGIPHSKQHPQYLGFGPWFIRIITE